MTRRNTFAPLIPGTIRAGALWLAAALAGGCLTNGLLDSMTDARGSSARLHPPLLLDPLMVTGTVGEFRGGNFHYGLDFSTGGKTGAPVYAVADGFIRQIMFGRYNIGYGIRIEHTDGRVSRYGHLDAFSKRVLGHPAVAGVHDRILLRRDFVLSIPDDSLAVRRGEVIASSGETGIGFAHLHFEYIDRDGRTWLNPLRYGLEIPDRRPPVFRMLTVTPATADSRLNGKNATLRIPLRPAGPPVWNPAPEQARFEQSYVPAKAMGPRDLRVLGGARFQLDAYDPAEPAGRSRLGLSEGRLYPTDRPDETLFAFRFDRLARVPDFYHGLLFDRSNTKLRGGARYLYNYYERAPGALPFVNGPATRPGALRGETSITLSGTDAVGNLATVTVTLDQDPGEAGVGAQAEAPDQPGLDPLATGLAPTVFADRDSVVQSRDGKASLSFVAGQTFEDLSLRVRSAGHPARLPPGMQAISPAFAFERQIAGGDAKTKADLDPTESYLDFLSPIPGSVAATSPRQARARPVQIGVYQIGRRGVFPLSLPEPMPFELERSDAKDSHENAAPIDSDAENSTRHTLYTDGRYHFRTRGTALFAVLVDRAPPTFQPVSPYAPGRLRKRPAKHREFRGDVYQRAGMRLFLRPADVGAGVDYSTLRVSVDGVECYTDHDPDRGHVEVFWPAHITQPGDHKLVANVRDKAGNPARAFRYAYRVIE
ncbi:MAG: M23 family metallopeptidase [Leptospirales bacterium]|jgi:hypothetical protein